MLNDDKTSHFSYLNSCTIYCGLGYWSETGDSSKLQTYFDWRYLQLNANIKRLIFLWYYNNISPNYTIWTNCNFVILLGTWFSDILKHISVEWVISMSPVDILHPRFIWLAWIQIFSINCHSCLTSTLNSIYLYPFDFFQC